MRKFVADTVVMVAPRTFCSNPETADSNAFQNHASSDSSLESVLKMSQDEFENFGRLLKSNGIVVKNFVEDVSKQTPDSLFPNNWFCTFPDKSVMLFPMFAENRRREVRMDIIESIQPSNVLDLTNLVEAKEFLEGTGSLIFDHDHKIAYACYSVRTTPKALAVFSEKSGYKVVSFRAQDEKGKDIYHTNVMMALGGSTAVVTLAAIQDSVERNALVKSIEDSGKTIVDISFDQMKSFAGNMLYLKNKSDERFWVCSSQAYESLTSENRLTLEKDGAIIHAPLKTIETYGGGGARCLLAEIY